MNNVIGIDVGSVSVRVGLFDQQGRRLLVSEDSALPTGGRDWVLEQIRERVRVLVDRTDYPVKACGVSFAGLVDFERQQVTSIHSPGWSKFSMAEWARQNLRLPCRVDNDANAGALGEYLFGAGQRTQSMVYLSLSTGIGTGFVCAGRVFRGKDNLAGELGHIPVSDSGVVCACGARGCLETFCSGAAIAQRGQDWADRRPEHVARILELSGGGAGGSVTAKAVVQAAAEGDAAAAQILREAARWLARALLTVMRILNPDKIVLGGGLAQAGVVLLNPVREFLEEFQSPSFSYTTEIVLAELGNYSPLYGAAALVLEIV